MHTCSLSIKRHNISKSVRSIQDFGFVFIHYMDTKGTCSIVVDQSPFLRPYSLESGGFRMM